MMTMFRKMIAISGPILLLLLFSAHWAMANPVGVLRPEPVAAVVAPPVSVPAAAAAANKNDDKQSDGEAAAAAAPANATERGSVESSKAAKYAPEDQQVMVVVGLERIPDAMRTYMEKNPGQYRCVLEITEVRGSIPPLVDGLFPSVFFLGEHPTPKLHLHPKIPRDVNGGRGIPPNMLSSVFSDFTVSARIYEQNTGAVVYAAKGVKGQPTGEEWTNEDGVSVPTYEFVLPENTKQGGAGLEDDDDNNVDEVDPELLKDD